MKIKGGNSEKKKQKKTHVCIIMSQRGAGMVEAES